MKSLKMLTSRWFNPSTFTTKKQLLTRLIFLIILLAALWLRLNNIGKFGFWHDEYFHVFAARSLLTDGSLYVPFVGDYERAKLVTYITAASFKVFGESEASARTPFALINIFFIILGYLLLLRLFSVHISLLFTFIMLFSPLCIEFARETRMYTMFQLAYFTMSVTFILGFHSTSRRSKLWFPIFVTNVEARYHLSLSLLILTLCLLWISVSLHDLTYNFGLVVIGYCIILFFYQIFLNGLRTALSSKYFLSLLIIAFFTLASLILKSEFVASLLQVSTAIPTWAPDFLKHHSYYRWQLQSNYPSLLFLYPVGAFVLIKRYGKPGLFFILSFVILIFCHSFWFGRKHMRYIFYIFPFFVVGACAAFERFVLPLPAFLLAQMQLKTKRHVVIFGVLLMPAAGIFLYPWLSDARNVHHFSKRADWKSFPEDLLHHIRGATIITTDPLAVKYYLNRNPDYYFIPEDERNPDLNNDNKLIKSYKNLTEIIERSSQSLLIADRFRFNNMAFLNDEMRDYISTQMEEFQGTFDRRIIAYKKGF